MARFWFPLTFRLSGQERGASEEQRPTLIQPFGFFIYGKGRTVAPRGTGREKS